MFVFTDRWSLFHRTLPAPPGQLCRPSPPRSGNPSSPSASDASPAHSCPETHTHTQLQHHHVHTHTVSIGDKKQLTFMSFSTRPSSPSLMTRVIISARSPALCHTHTHTHTHVITSCRHMNTSGRQQTSELCSPWRASSLRTGSCWGLRPCCRGGTSCVHAEACRTERHDGKILARFYYTMFGVFNGNLTWCSKCLYMTEFL